jgi:hypothetical protein
LKIARILGLAAIAALALLALAGAGSALAAETTLCKSSTESPYCTSEESYPASTTVQASTSSPLILENTALKVECDSTLEGATSSAAGNPLSVSVSSWTFSCAKGACPSKIESLPTGSITGSSGADGQLALRVGGKSPEWTINCPGFYNCTYGFPDMTVKGGSPGQVAVAESKLTLIKKNGVLPCPAMTLKPGSFNINSPKPVYVATKAELSTRLCQKQEAPCSAANTYPEGTKFEASASNFKIATLGTNHIECENAKVAPTSLATGSEPIPLEMGSGSFTLNGCRYPSISNSCTAYVNLETGSIAKWAGGYSESYIELRTNLEFLCSVAGGYKVCKWSTQNARAHMDYSKELSAFYFSESQLTSIKGNECGSLGLLTARFEVSNPKGFYITGHF